MLKTIISYVLLLFFLASCQQANVQTSGSSKGINPEAVRAAIQQAHRAGVKRNPDSEFLLDQNQGRYNQALQHSDAPFNLAVKSVEDYIKDWLLRPTEVAPIALDKPQKPTTPEASVLTKGEFETTKQFQVRLTEEKARYSKALSDIKEAYIAKVAVYNATIKAYNNEVQWEQKIREERVNSIRIRLLGTAINEVLGEPKLTNLEYNADKEIFTAKVIAANSTVSYDILIPVAIVDAPDFKAGVEQSSVAMKMDVNGKIKPINFKINTPKGVTYAAYLADTKSADAITKQRSTGVSDIDINDVIIDEVNTLKVDAIIDRNEQYFGKFF